VAPAVKAKGSGRLRSVSFDKCLEAEKAEAGSALQINHCQENSTLQNWHCDRVSAIKLAETKDEANDHLCLGMVGATKSCLLNPTSQACSSTSAETV